ncbi:MAG: leucine-rich repeat domain-containing protein [Clostridiales bacterium]|nr:leucine-rich repeat domain-containing protein [Clostridiales bacterium]
MSKKLIAILASCVTVCLAVGIILISINTNDANNENTDHVHNFNGRRITQEYLATNPTCTEKAKYYYSCDCGEKDIDTFEHGSPLDHAYGEFITNGNGTHTKTCSRDNTHTITENCSGGTASCTNKAICVNCDTEYGDLEEHKYLTLKYDNTKHWHECICGDKSDIENHTPGAPATENSNQICTECKYIVATALGHVHTLHLTKVDAIQQSCTKEGNIEYYTCTCGKWFTDSTATTEIFDKDSVVIEKDNHDYTLEYNETQHWYECICGDKINIEDHKGGTATCTEKAVCSTCETSYGNLKGHEYIIIKYNETQHWYECVCGDKINIEDHKGGTATCTQKAVCSTCETSYGNLKGHEYIIIKYNETQHWYECVCGDKINIEDHKGGTATCTQKAVCSTCETAYGNLKDHQHTIIKYNETQHWNECSCGDYQTKENHKGGTATETTKAICSVCNQPYGELLEKPTTEGLEFTLINNGTEYSVTGYTGSSTNVYIPATHEDKLVTAIGEAAFNNCSLLSNIIIPNTIKSIGNYAFRACFSLESIVIPNSVTTIGENVFYFCTVLDTIYCEAEDKPTGWDSNWNRNDYNGSYHDVYWGYNGN